MRLLSYILRALCAVAVGFLLVSNPSTMADLLIQVVGGLFGLLGLGTIVGYFTSRRQSPSGSALRPVFPFAGLGSLAFGAILIVWPTQFKEIFMYVVGGLLVLFGLSQFWGLFKNRKVAPLSFSLFLIPLLVVIASGVMILLYPTESASLPFTVFGIIAICYGVNEFFLGLRLWRFQKLYDAQFIQAEEVTEAEAEEVTEAEAEEIPDAKLIPGSTTNPTE
ncbi:MAG: DUF308 domain-containing protein [Bacteroidaceae bacterium]|nr:DUF308 domain-containing protein [Bacteroidaceae bacterium]MBR0244133.1 DUF308 domain-containing protein [Bacteroidaceae bacterium]MBR1665345.1 DUF308 domain-containing protein [Bacteroidaceae bacterium]